MLCGKRLSVIPSAKVELAKFQGQQQLIDQQREQAEKTARIQANMPVLMQSLKPYGTVRQTERGIVLTLNDTYFGGVRAVNLSATGDSKLSNLAMILANSKDYKIAVESHIDNKGTPDELQGITDARAQAILGKLTAAGIDSSAVEAKGFGASLPVVPNTTNLNRAKNRRVDIILSPNI